MAEPEKNKVGLHKSVSSVLKGVPIPQGVRNWRPADKFGPDRTGDSSAVPKSDISSVFKGVPVAPDDDARSHVGKHPQNNCAEVSPADTPDDRQTSQSNLVKKHDCPEESLAKAVRTKQPESASRVVYYHDPIDEAATRTLGQRMQDNFFAPREWLRAIVRRLRGLD